MKHRNLTKNIMICLLTLYCVASFMAIAQYQDNLRDSHAETLKRSIEKAAVQCYALEGNYPPNLGYLEQNYGIQLDKTKYHIDYFVFASNIRPIINVIEKAGSK